MSEDYLVIAGSAFAGAFWCLASADTKCHADALKLLARITSVVAGLGYVGGYLMNKYIGLLYPWDVATACFILGATAEYHPGLLKVIVKRFKKAKS